MVLIVPDNKKPALSGRVCVFSRLCTSGKQKSPDYWVGLGFFTFFAALSTINMIAFSVKVTNDLMPRIYQTRTLRAIGYSA